MTEREILAEVRERTAQKYEKLNLPSFASKCRAGTYNMDAPMRVLIEIIREREEQRERAEMAEMRLEQAIEAGVAETHDRSACEPETKLTPDYLTRNEVLEMIEAAKREVLQKVADELKSEAESWSGAYYVQYSLYRDALVDIANCLDPEVK